MRGEYDEEVVGRVLCYSPEQTGYRELVYVGSHHQKGNE